MIEDKELVEVWKKQFEDWAYDYPGDALSKKYLEQAWIAARRSQPSVVLPMVVPIQDGFSGKLKPYFRKRDILGALTAAGIKYTIGE